MTATKAVFGDLTQQMNWAVQSAAQAFYSSCLPLETLHEQMPEEYRQFAWYLLAALTRDTLDQNNDLVKLPTAIKEFVVVVMFLAFAMGYTWGKNAQNKPICQDA